MRDAKPQNTPRDGPGVLRNGVPIIQPPLTKLLTDRSERRIRNEFIPRPVLKKK
jgi:hypothetical protein